MQVLGEKKKVSYDDLYMFHDVHWPLESKTPKLDMYEGHGDPSTYLKRFCNQLRGERKEKLLIAYFG